MAYALLGNLSPVVGIYMSVFPVIIYTIMGTSKHISMGILSTTNKTRQINCPIDNQID